MGGSVGVLRDGVNDGTTMGGNDVIDGSSSLIDISENDVVKTKVPKTDKLRKLISAALKQQILFESLSSQQIDDIVDVFAPMSCSAGEIIINHGVTGDYM
jgi:hypothetical protein